MHILHRIPVGGAQFLDRSLAPRVSDLAEEQRLSVESTQQFGFGTVN